MKRFFNTTSKILIWFVILNGEMQIYLTYLLAFLGKTSVLEQLGKTIALEIVAPVALLVLKAVIENVFEKNIIFPHADKQEENSDSGNEVNEPPTI